MKINKIIYIIIFGILSLGYLLPIYKSRSATPVMNIRFSVDKDGAPLFDNNDDPGNDSSANNGRVRNLDIIKYKVEVNINELGASNVITADVTLSEGAYWLELPNSCLTENVNPVSSISEDGRTLVCNTGDQMEGTAVVIYPIAYVKGSNPDGSIISAQASATADGANIATSDILETTTTAVPKVDLRKIFFKESNWENNGPNGEEGRILTYAVALVAERGSEPLDSTIPITFTDVFDNGGTDPSTKNTARLYTWGSKDACRPKDEDKFHVNYYYDTLDFPFGKLGIAPLAIEKFSVTDSGNINCVQGDDGDNTTFDPISLTITDADLTANQTPTVMPLYQVREYSVNDKYIASYLVDIWVPRTDLEQLEFMSDTGAYQITSTNSVSDFDPVSITGQSNYHTGIDNQNNNNAEHTLNLNPITGFRWLYTHTAIRYPYFDAWSRNPVFVLAGDKVKFLFSLNYSKHPELVGKEHIMCVKTNPNKASFSETTWSSFDSENMEYMTDIYDNTLKYIPTGTPYDVRHKLIYGADGIFCSGDEGISEVDNYCFEGERNNPYVFDPNLSLGEEVKLEYSTKELNSDGQDERTATCNDDDGPWYTDINDIPGGLESATRVRFKFIGKDGVDTKLSYQIAKVYLDFDIKDDLSTGDIVPFFASHSLNGGTSWNHADVQAGDPATSNYALDSTRAWENAKRVIVSSAKVRTNRSSDVTQIKAGDSVNFTIDSTLESGVDTITSVTIVDTIPKGLDYVEGSYTHSELSGNQTISGPVITTGSNGETILTWTISDVHTGEALPQINYQVVSDVKLTYEEFVTTTLIASPIDVDSIQGERTSMKTIVLKENGTFNIMELAFDPTEFIVEVNRPIRFKLTYANLSDEIGLSKEQFIEVFPFNGDDRIPGTNYTGTLEFDSIVGYYGETFEYTNHDITEINFDPCHESNIDSGVTSTDVCNSVIDDDENVVAGTGEVKWYDCSGGFDDPVNCPISKSEVTGVRITSPALPIGTPRQSMDLILTPTGNTEGDVYTNDFGGRAKEIDLPVRSNDITITVVMSSLGDRVWFDLNGDGVQDLQEPGIPGVKVDLYSPGPDGVDGTDDDINLSTTTDENGIYIFDELFSSEYTVTIDETTLPQGLVQTYDLDGVDTPHIATDYVGIDEDRLDFDFGYQANSSLGDFVWKDENENGIQDSGELGVSDISVSAVWAGLDGDFSTQADNVTFTMTTDENGNYLFENIPSGNYIVSIEKPDSLLFTTKNQGSDDELDSDADLTTGQSDQITLASGEDKRDVDFGLVDGPYCGDGILQEGEQCDDGNNIDGDGCNANCTLEIEPPVPPVPPTPPTPVPPTPVPPTPPTPVPPTPKERTGSIGDDIWYDTVDCYENRSDKSGMEDIRVKLIWAGPDNKFGNDDDEVWRTDTNHNGHYIFEDLPPGKYRVIVKEEDVVGWVQTYDPSDSENMNNQLTLELDEGEDYMKADFGYSKVEICDEELAKTGWWFW